MYELHKLPTEFPMSFKSYTLTDKQYFVPHWHENIEIIHITEGRVRLLLDSKEVQAGVGDTLIVNTNVIHQFFAEKGSLSYHCLIMSVDFLKQVGLDFSRFVVKDCVNDNNIALLFSSVDELIKRKPPYYKAEVLGEALRVASMLLRNYTDEVRRGDLGRKNVKTEIVKKAVSYMKENFADEITLEKICEEIGASRSYFCHSFKEMTGMTATAMLNFIRCREAKRILMNSEYNVCETANRCGFTNMSYFSKTYRAIMGQKPSETMQERQ